MSAGKPQPGPERNLLVLVFFLGVAVIGLALAYKFSKGKKGAPTAAAVQSNAASKAHSATALPTPAGKGTNEAAETPADLENRAVELMGEGKVDEALAYLNRAVKMNPDDETTHFNLAFAYSKAGRINEAVKEYEEALKLFPDYSEAHNNLGNLLVLQKKYEEAIGHFSQSIQLSPDNANTLNNMGRVLSIQGQPQEAVSFFTDAVRINPTYLEARCNLGNALVAVGKVNEGIKEFQEALRQSPDFPPALKGMARARAKLANPAGK